MSVKVGDIDMTKLRIAHCTQSTYGGTHRYIMDLILRQHHEITVICPHDQFLSSDARRHGLRTINIPMVREISLVHDFITLLRLYRLFCAENFDVVHLHSSKAGFLGRIAAKLAKIPVVVYQPHGWAFHEFMPRWKFLFFVWLEKLVGRLADRIICISNEELNNAREYRIAPPDKLSLVLSGIDLSIFFPQPEVGAAVRVELGLSPTDVVVGAVIRLDERKGPDVLIRAAQIVCKEMPNVKFVLVGDGPMRAELETIAKELQKEGSVIFTGWRSDVPRVINAFDIGVLPSRAEGFGLAAAEYMATGKPVVASAVGGLLDIVEDGRTGLLVSPDDPVALARALLLLANDQKLREVLGTAGLKRVRKLFDVNRMVKEIEEIYTAISEEKGLKRPVGKGRYIETTKGGRIRL